MLYKSSKQIMDRTTRELKPEFTFDTDGERMVWRQYFDDGAYNTRYFSRSQMCIILHVHYIEDKNPDRLQKLVDSGELYDYLTDLYERVEDAVIMLDINDLHILCHSPVDSLIDPINDLSVILSNVILNVYYYKCFIIHFYHSHKF